MNQTQSKYLVGTLIALEIVLAIRLFIMIICQIIFASLFLAQTAVYSGLKSDLSDFLISVVLLIGVTVLLAGLKARNEARICAGLTGVLAVLTIVVCILEIAMLAKSELFSYFTKEPVATLILIPIFDLILSMILSGCGWLLCFKLGAQMSAPEAVVVPGGVSQPAPTSTAVNPINPVFSSNPTSVSPAKTGVGYGTGNAGVGSRVQQTTASLPAQPTKGSHFQAEQPQPQTAYSGFPSPPPPGQSIEEVEATARESEYSTVLKQPDSVAGYWRQEMTPRVIHPNQVPTAGQQIDDEGMKTVLRPSRKDEQRFQ